MFRLCEPFKPADWSFPLWVPASGLSDRLDDVVARNKNCKQDEAYSACGKLNPGKHIKYLKSTSTLFIIY